jgi:stage IV sporulation protein FB
MKFRVGNIPVRVTLWFAITTFGMARDLDAVRALAWFGIVFLSVLVHELGHAMAGRALGLTQPTIELHGMGGTASWGGGKTLRPWEDIQTSFAGPLAGFLLGALVYVYARILPPESGFADWIVRSFLWVNVGWGLVNLMPVLPFDGGHILRATLRKFAARRADSLSRYISVGVAAVAIVGSLYLKMTGLAFLFGFAVFINVRGLQTSREYSFKTGMAAAVARVQTFFHRGGKAAAKPARSQKDRTYLRLVEPPDEDLPPLPPEAEERIRALLRGGKKG